MIAENRNAPAAVLVQEILANRQLDMSRKQKDYLKEVCSKSTSALQFSAPVIIRYTASSPSISKGTDFPSCSISSGARRGSLLRNGIHHSLLKVVRFHELCLLGSSFSFEDWPVVVFDCPNRFPRGGAAL